eukprot:1133754-Prymnesium_polylepis.1
MSRAAILALCLAQPGAAFLLAPTARALVRVQPRLASSSSPYCAERGSFEEEQKEAERAETIEYFKTLGGFSFGSLGLFVALTTGAGMEDVLAGNIVLVALCAYG